MAKLKNGDKIKVNDEEYFVDSFHDGKGYDESSGVNSRIREIVLSKKDNGSKKLLKETYKINVNEKLKSVNLIKTSEKKERSKDGFSYEKSAVTIGYSGDGNFEDNENNEIEYEISDDLEDRY